MKISEIVRSNRWKIVSALLVLGAFGLIYYFYGDQITKENIIAYGQDLHAATFLIAFLILPLFGAPVSLFLILAGIRFGVGWGMAAASVGIMFHHVMAFWVSHGLLRQKISNFAEKRGQTIPSIDKGNQVWYTALFAAVHGPPYALKLYLLALTDVPFAIYFWIGAPIYILFSIVPVGAAAAAVHFDVTWIYVSIAAISLLVIVVKWIKKCKTAA